MNTEVLGAIPKYSEQYLSHCYSVHNKSRMDCTWDRKVGLRGDLSANKRPSQGTVSMLNARYKIVPASLRNCQKTHSVSIVNIKANYIHVSAQTIHMSPGSFRMSPRKVPICLRVVSACLGVKYPNVSAQCPCVSAQSVSMSQRKVSVCLRAKCSHVSAQSIRLSPRQVSVCLRAKCLFPLSILTQNRTLSTNFSKTPKYEVSQKIRRVSVALLDADGRTDRHGKANSRF